MLLKHINTLFSISSTFPKIINHKRSINDQREGLQRIIMLYTWLKIPVICLLYIFGRGGIIYCLIKLMSILLKKINSPFSISSTFLRSTIDIKNRLITKNSSFTILSQRKGMQRTSMINTGPKITNFCLLFFLKDKKLFFERGFDRKKFAAEKYLKRN